MTSRRSGRSTIPDVDSLLDSIAQSIVRSEWTLEHSNTMLGTLSDCIRICADAPTRSDEPLRIVHHLSCVGGTLITKCIASMANILVLNELDYHSSLTSIAQGHPSFAPSDMVSLLRQGDVEISSDLISQLLIENLRTVISDQRAIGRTVLVREHSHGLFLVGDAPMPHHSLQAILSMNFPVRAIVTVRDPAESYLSMVNAGWHTHFEPSNFGEYAKRYHAFLDAHDETPIVQYEALARTPEQSMQDICKHLDLQYFPDFQQVFGLFQFSGDSGRGGRSIKLYKAREDADKFRTHSSYRDLADRLGYDSAIEP